MRNKKNNKHVSLIIIFSLFLIGLYAKESNITLLAKNYETTQEYEQFFVSPLGDIFVKDMLVNQDGNLTLIGTIKVDDVQNILLLQTDAKGQKLVKLSVYVNETNHVVTKFIQTSDGGFALAAYGILMKLDETGVEEFEKNLTTYGGNIVDIVETPDEDFVLLLQRYLGNSPTFMKTDNSGNVIWNKTYYEYFEEIEGLNFYTVYGSSFVRLNDGSFLIVGSICIHESNHFFLLKVDENGVFQWLNKHNLDIPMYNRISKVNLIQTNDDDFLLAGGNGQYNYVAKFDLQSDLKWNYSTPLLITINDLIQTNDGEYTMVGSRRDSLSLESNYTMNLLFLDIYGKYKSSYRFSTDYENHGISLIQTSDEGFIIASNVLLSNGTAGIRLAKLSSLTKGVPGFNSSIVFFVLITLTILLRKLNFRGLKKRRQD